MTTSAIIINLVLAVVVTAFVAGIAVSVPLLLDRPARRARVARPAVSRANANWAAESDEQLAA